MHVPADIVDLVQAVLGLDDRPQARTHLKLGGALGEGELPARRPSRRDAPRPAGPRAAEASPRPDPSRCGRCRSPSSTRSRRSRRQRRDHRDHRARGGIHRCRPGRVLPPRGRSRPRRWRRLASTAMPTSRASTPCRRRGSARHRGGGAMAPGVRIVVYFADTSDRGFLDALHDRDARLAAIRLGRLHQLGQPEARMDQAGPRRLRRGAGRRGGTRGHGAGRRRGPRCRRRLRRRAGPR